MKQGKVLTIIIRKNLLVLDVLLNVFIILLNENLKRGIKKVAFYSESTTCSLFQGLSMLKTTHFKRGLKTLLPIV